MLYTSHQFSLQAVRGHREYEYSAHIKLIYTQNIKLQKIFINKTNMALIKKSKLYRFD